LSNKKLPLGHTLFIGSIVIGANNKMQFEGILNSVHSRDMFLVRVVGAVVCIALFIIFSLVFSAVPKESP
jgi:hypothetical protein